MVTAVPAPMITLFDVTISASAPKSTVPLKVFSSGAVRSKLALMVIVS